jgi:hypothetical protein
MVVDLTSNNVQQLFYFSKQNRPFFKVMFKLSGLNFFSLTCTLSPQIDYVHHFLPSDVYVISWPRRSISNLCICALQKISKKSRVLQIQVQHICSKPLNYITQIIHKLLHAWMHVYVIDFFIKIERHGAVCCSSIIAMLQCGI